MIVLPELSTFADWLRGRPWDAIIGERLLCAGCPLALWLMQALQASCVQVTEHEIAIERTQDEWVSCVTPRDYRMFIEAIDYAGETPRRAVLVIEAQSALKMLLREQAEEDNETKTEE